MVNWNLYLARYQMTHGGSFFGSGEWDCNSQLVLPQEGKQPLLVLFSTDPCGRSTMNSLRCRTMVRLDKPYRLHIGPRGLVGGGISSVAGLVGRDMDFGFSEAKGRVITTDNDAFTKLVLGDLALRNALKARKGEQLEIRPGPQQDGWHMVEVSPNNLEGLMKDSSPWVNDAMKQDTNYMSPEDREVILQAGSAHFDAQLDAFLDVLRAARDAVTMWPIR